MKVAKRLCGIMLLLIIMGCSKSQPNLYALKGEAFGTTYSIQYYNLEPLELQSGIDSVIQAVNQSVSTYLPDSDISKVNRGDSTLVTDQIFAQVFKLSERVYQESEGYFDPTIGVLRNAYGFGDVKPLEVIDSLVLDSLMQMVGFDLIVHKCGVLMGVSICHNLMVLSILALALLPFFFSKYNIHNLNSANSYP